LNSFLAGGASKPGESKWAEFRDEQRQALSEPNTAMVVTIDIGDPHNIHPRNKREVARRLSLAALAAVYGKDIPYSGPLYSTMETEGNGIRVHFEHTTGGLGIKGGKTVNGFTIAGQDRQFKPAAAKIEGDSVLVFSPEVPYPAAVRYGWGDNPECNLFNKVGLPASPFRTDDWPGAVREMR
jgi:sialate O-acetylesterase